MIPEESWRMWLDPDAKPDDLLAMLRAAPVGTFEAYQVSKYVNKPGNEGSACIETDPDGPKLL